MWESQRVVIVAAHPDDETIGLGGQLGFLRDVTLIHATDGAPRSRADWPSYARTRRQELLNAMSVAGVPPGRCIELGIPDQQAARCLPDLMRRLSRIFAELNPGVILTHPYEGGHPDHDAVAFAVHQSAKEPRQLWEFCSYHRHPAGSGIETGCFLHNPATPVRSIVLTGEQRARKARMRRCFVSQTETLEWFRERAIERECFRRAPCHDFSRPPHPGKLFYEFFDWGMHGAEWREFARRAMAHV